MGLEPVVLLHLPTHECVASCHGIRAEHGSKDAAKKGASGQERGQRKTRNLSKEIMGLREEVEGIDEDDFDFVKKLRLHRQRTLMCEYLGLIVVMLATQMFQQSVVRVE